MFFGAVPP